MLEKLLVELLEETEVLKELMEVPLEELEAIEELV